jgi:hypothetical protein
MQSVISSASLTLHGLRITFYGFNGAGDGIRTRDPNLGKVVLYQLSYTRMDNRLTPGVLRSNSRTTALKKLS